MKKIIALILALIFMLSLVACNNTETPAPEAPAANGDTTNEETPVQQKTLKINGVDISEYKIVYAKNPDAYKYSIVNSSAKGLVKQDTEYDKQTAQNLAALIEKNFGAKLSIVTDGKAATDKEIIIGNTARGLEGQALAAYNAANDKDMCIQEKNGKLIIVGASYGATWQAAEKFVELCMGMSSNDVNIESGYSFKAKANIIVVGCIGDSLTFGTKSTKNYESKVDSGMRSDIVPYPAVLQRMAWKDMVVYNYGKGGRTMTENHCWDDNSDGKLDGDRAWIKTEEHDKCMANAKNLDLVLIMLGTNDSSKTRSTAAGYTFELGGAYEQAFINSCKNIVNELKAKNANVRVALLNCPIAFSSNIEPTAEGYIRKYQAKAAQQLGLDLLDMYTYTKNNTQKSDYPDDLHPTDEGYAKYAEGVYSMITPIVNQMLGKQ